MLKRRGTGSPLQMPSNCSLLIRTTLQVCFFFYPVPGIKVSGGITQRAILELVFLLYRPASQLGAVGLAIDLRSLLQS